MSTTRHPCAVQFYQGDCKSQIEGYAKGFTPPELPERVVAGIVPHAGWFFSGETAAKVFLTIKAKSPPRTFILLGAVHVPGVWTNCMYASGEWVTPLGPIQVDEEEAGRLLDCAEDILVVDHNAHKHEHSIEVQAPMIKYLFPEAKIVPIAVPPSKEAVELGGRIGRLIKDEKMDAVVIGTTDLTHYGDNYGFSPAGYGSKAHDWMLKNDRRIIDLVVSLKPNDILREAVAHRNACGPGAMAAATAAAKALGAPCGRLLQHTTSYDVYPVGEFDMAVGYAGIVF